MGLPGMNRVCAIFTAVLIGFSSPAVHAARYDFSIGGFSGNATSANGTILGTYTNGQISGYFEAEDKFNQNGDPVPDGLINSTYDTYDRHEITDLSAITYTGNDFFESLNGAGPYGGYNFDLSYNIKTNTLGLDVYSARELSFFAHALTPNIEYRNYNDFPGDGSSRRIFGVLTLNLDGNQAKVNLGITAGEGFDKDGNPAPNSSLSSVSLSSSQQAIVTQTPLPGALGLFVSGLAWLGIVRRKKTVKARLKMVWEA